MQPNEAISKLRDISKKRKFSQTFDLIFALKDIDMKKPDNHIRTEVFLPKGRGKALKVCCIMDKNAANVRDVCDTIVTKEQLHKMNDVKKINDLVENNDYFFAEVSLMVDVGKKLGRYLGPKGKMPKPLPPNVDPKPLIERARKSTRIIATTPTIQCGIGTEDMKDDEIEANLKAVYDEVVKKLPKGKNQIKSVYLKLTMSPPLEVSI